MTTLSKELRTYAQQTAYDNDCDYDTAVHMMSDEPGEVAGDLEMDVSDVLDWCRKQGE